MLQVACSWCGGSMPEERKEFFDTCIKCTDQSIPLALMNYSGKTAGTVEIIRGGPEAERQALNVYRRKR